MFLMQLWTMLSVNWRTDPKRSILFALHFFSLKIFDITADETEKALIHVLHIGLLVFWETFPCETNLQVYLWERV